LQVILDWPAVVEPKTNGPIIKGSILATPALGVKNGQK
jgi:hypothetical protein